MTGELVIDPALRPRARFFWELTEPHRRMFLGHDDPGFDSIASALRRASVPSVTCLYERADGDVTITHGPQWDLRRHEPRGRTDHPNDRLIEPLSQWIIGVVLTLPWSDAFLRANGVVSLNVGENNEQSAKFGHWTVRVEESDRKID